MSQLPVPLHNLPTTAPPVSIPQLIGAFLSGKSQHTLEAYRRDLADFATFLGAINIDQAARQLLSNGHGNGNLIAINYRNHLVGLGLSPATINRRISALRSLVSLAKTLGLVPWSLEAKGIKSTALRDTRGCGLDGFKLLLAAARNQRDATKALRDKAILRLLFDLALRRSEVVSLDLKDVDLPASQLMVMGKGKLEKEPMTLPDETKKVIEDWLRVRGSEAGPLFINRDRAGKGNRLTPSGLYKMVKYLGRKATVKARPHGIRHAAITTVLDLMHGDVRVAQRFARHASPSTTIKYDDNRQDLGGNAARKLAARVPA